MHWIDWCITLLPLTFVLGMAVYSRRYVRGVADYLAAGRVARRYVISVSNMEIAIGLLVLVATVEAKYQTGYAIGFWESTSAVLGMILAMTGYCVYRYRETKAMSLGQFLEMRYNRPLRVYAAFLRAIANIMSNAIAPAVAANFFIYFLGLPHRVHIFGLAVPTFLFLVAGVLTLAMVVIWTGGRISLLITDCIQGLMSYPIFVIINIYILCNFSMLDEITPIMMDRMPGESFINPYDIEKLRDFNLFALLVTIVSMFLNRVNDSNICGRTPHEEKMAGVLGYLRAGLCWIMCVQIAVCVITVMSHENYADRAREIRLELSGNIIDEVVADDATRSQMKENLSALPAQRHRIGVDPPLSRKQNTDTTYLETARETLGDVPNGSSLFQKFNTLYHQMLLASVMRNVLPVGITGLFCLMMVMMMLSTDDSRIIASSSIIIQDIVVPLRKKPMTPEQHVLWLRLSSLGVVIFFFLFSVFFTQIDYIIMFTTIMSGIWLGGAGTMLVFGLYSRFGNSVGAFGSLIVGSCISVGGAVLQGAWVKYVYPFIDNRGWTQTLDSFLRMITSPFSPYVRWEMDPMKFPINSYEIFFLAMISSLLMYVVLSLLTYRKPYNLDRMLHRGKYSIDGIKNIISPWTWKSVWGKLIGITPEYTRGDKVIAWTVFGYGIVLRLGVLFFAVIIWNAISPWPREWWKYFFYVKLNVFFITGMITTVWFMIGGIVDIRRLLKDLAARVDNPLDDGRVEGHVSLMDKELLGNNEDNGQSG
jgi:SSS family solute:Na+ symporter